MVKWEDINIELQSKDDGAVLRALRSLSELDGALSQEACGELIPRCMQKLQHHDIAVRRYAMSCIAKQFREDNTPIAAQTETLCKMLQTPNVLDLNAGSDNTDHFQTFHKDLCFVVMELQNKFPKRLMAHFKPIGMYLVESISKKDHVVATAACEYWAKMNVPPVPHRYMDQWVPVVMAKLPKLIPALLQCMVYSDAHIRHLESQQCANSKQQNNSNNSQQVNGTSTTKLPADIEKLSNLRNYAALSFENLCRIFQTETVAIFKQYLMKWLGSSDWKEVEAMILALGAFTEAMGTPKEMKDVYPTLIPKLLEFYSHPQPLIRAITCFAMQHFINFSMKNLKDPFPKMIKCTTALLSDPLVEVQVMAIRSLATMLAYAERDVAPYAGKLTEAISKANHMVHGEARYPYYECVGHMFGRMADVLEQSHITQLLTPLMDHWKSLNADDDSQDEAIMLCQALCVIAMFAKSNFDSYNDIVFQKACTYITKTLQVSQSDGDVNTEVVTNHLVAYMDVLSAVFEGQGQAVNPYAEKYNLASHNLQLLKENDFQDKVHQSGLALLGHLCRHSFNLVKPHLTAYIDIIDAKLMHHTDGLKNNALWSLGHIAQKNDERNDKLLQMSGKLVTIVREQRQGSDAGVTINAALALTNLGQKWPQQLGPMLTRPENFQPLCILLQTMFPRDQEKVDIIKNLCKFLPPFYKKIAPEDWSQFCIAVAVFECSDETLLSALRNFLRDLRTTVGNKGWNQIAQQIGPQLSITMRKKYKLY